MIVLDSHAWVWWVHEAGHLTEAQRKAIAASEAEVVGVSAIWCWEIAKLVEYGRLELPTSLDEWFDQALDYPGVQLLALTPEIAIESTRLPGEFHRDPADQVIVATARRVRMPACNVGREDHSYPHVTTIR